MKPWRRVGLRDTSPPREPRLGLGRLLIVAGAAALIGALATDHTGDCDPETDDTPSFTLGAKLAAAGGLLSGAAGLTLFFSVPLERRREHRLPGAAKGLIIGAAAVGVVAAAAVSFLNALTCADS